MHVTLNLLPPANKAALRTGFVFAYVQSILIIVMVMALLAAGTLAAMRMQVQGVYEDFTARSTTSSREFDTMIEETKAINGYLTRMEAMRMSTTSWSTVLRTVTELTPSGIRISGIRAGATGIVSVTGTAATREDVLAMRDSLEVSPLFEKVQSPLSNILQQRDVKFDFEMQYVKQ